LTCDSLNVNNQGRGLIEHWKTQQDIIV